MAVERVVNNPTAMDTAPGNPGQWQFFKQGFTPSTGVVIDSEGNITAAGTVTAAGVVNTGPVTLTGATAGTTVLSAQVTGDAQPRFTVGADGKLQLGGGSVAPDVNLYRYAVGGLATDNTLKLAGSSTLLLGPAGDVNVYRNSAGNLATDDSIVAAAVGKGLQIKEGSGARMGVATLVAGTVTVANTSVTASTRIFLTAQTSGAAPGALRVSTLTAGTSFVITSTSGTDTSVVAWLLIEPAP
ncbi:hypothetical protein AB0D63_43270 [Kitasatospora sp. NPDC048343]|uniref:hypothetical protein n=1 Tax=Kitasatospora sp. NPDC048343 TaxID=3154717 RepID=UPI0034009C75